MRVWAAPVVDGVRQDTEEVEVPTEGLTVLAHNLPWPRVAYRYEYAQGEYFERVERAANDPARVERRKGIAPAMTVPRHRV